MVDDIPSPGVVVRIVPGGATDAPSGVAAGALIVQVRPNPSRHGAQISWYQRAEGAVQLSIFDLSGRALYSTTRRDGAGWHSLDTSRHLVPGVYLVEARSSAGSSSAKFVLVGG